VQIDPPSASLQWCGLRVLELSRDIGVSFTTGTLEMAVLPLSGEVTVEVEGRRFDLRDRTHVFHGVADWAYLPIDAEVRLSSRSGAQVAVPVRPRVRSTTSWPPACSTGPSASCAWRC
jgi:5-deoxy-glucuronate isomerase